MPTTGLHSLDSSIHRTNEWLSQLALDLGVRDKLVAFNALRAVLASLREVLPLSASAELAAELPLMVRGVYFDDWAPSREPLHRGGLATRIGARLDAPMQSEPVMRATFVLLDSRLSRSVVATLKRELDDEARALWPASLPSSASRMRTSDSNHPSSNPASKPASNPAGKPSSRRG
jgi:uncharacterized protein (DUF2267 family)